MTKPTLKSIKQKRDGSSGAVLIVPHIVLNSAAYTSLLGSAIKLLYDIAMQYNTRNNGALLASFRYMSEKRGWTSSDALTKAKAQLIDHLLLVQTVQGQRPNKVSWYGLTWLSLDDIRDLEINSNNWPRGAYARWQEPSAKEIKRKPPPAASREKHYERMRLRAA